MPQQMRPLEPYESSLAFFGSRLRNWRTRRRLSQQDLGRLVHVSRDLIGKIEKAQRRPAPELVERLDAVLAADGDLVALTGTVHDRAQRQRSAITLSGSGASIDSALIVNLQGVLSGLRRMDHSLGSGAVLNAVLAQARMAEELLPIAVGAVRDGLLGVLAEIQQLAGWIHFDQGALGAADRSFKAARRHAEAAGDAALLAFVLGPSHGFAATYTGNPELGLRLGEAAVEHARGSGNARLTAFTLTIRARALAKLRAAGACLDHLDEAAELLGGHAGADQDPDWLAVFDSAALRGHRGSCLLDLGRPAEAVAPLTEEDATADAVFVRNRTIWLLDRADAKASLGLPVEAAADVREAWAAAAPTSSPRVARRMGATMARLDGWRGIPEVAELRQAVGSHLGSRVNG